MTKIRVEAELKLRNGHVREALKARGWTNADLSRAIGVDQTMVGRIVNMRLKGFSWDTQIGKAAVAISKELRLHPDDVIPPAVIGRDVECARAIGEVGLAQLESMSGGALLLPDRSEESIDDQLDAKQRVDEVLDQMDQRMASVLRARFGIGERHKTLAEVGRAIGTSVERTRQIESRGLRRARELMRATAAKRTGSGFVEFESAPRMLVDSQE